LKALIEIYIFLLSYAGVFLFMGVLADTISMEGGKLELEGLLETRTCTLARLVSFNSFI